MTAHITAQELEEKVQAFIVAPASSVQSLMNIGFGDDLLRFPIETKDGKLIETAFYLSPTKQEYVAGLSAQAGCTSKCTFCDLGSFPSKNISSEETVDQLRLTLQGAKKRGYDVLSKPVKASFVLGGEPLANPYFPDALETLAHEVPVKLKISSIAPAGSLACRTYDRIVTVAEAYPNIVQFQISLNSTDNEYRQQLAGIPVASFDRIREMGEKWNAQVPNPRLVDLTFTINEQTPMDPVHIRDILPPDLFAVRLREYVPTERGARNSLSVITHGRILELQKRFGDAGYMIIPGSPGDIENKFSMQAGSLLKIYSQMRTGMEAIK